MSRISQIMPQAKVTRQENADCSVVALSVCLDLPYEECKSLLAREAEYSAGEGVYDWRLKLTLKSLGFRLIHSENRRTLTLRELVPQLQHGRFIVHIRGHVFAVIDGVAHDNRLYRRSPYVEWYAKIP